LQPLLEIIDLVTEFRTEDGHTRAVDHVSFKVGKGKILGVVGESGSGKSVTSLSLMRLLNSANASTPSGQALFHEYSTNPVDLLSIPEQEMRAYRGNEIAMIFQEPMTSLNPVKRCGEQVAEAIRLHKKLNHADAEIATIELFKKVRLPRPESIYKSYPHEISGGQKQRVMIAMAISCEPHLLIADEPTTALDVTVQKAILDLLAELQESLGMGIIFITHDLGVVAEIADEVAVMYQGKIVEQGPVRKVFLNPEHPYTKGLIACRPPLDKHLVHLPTVGEMMDILENEDQDIPTEKILERWTISDEERRSKVKKVLSGKKVLEVSGLSKHYSSSSGFLKKKVEVVRAVDDVTFDVHKGETLGLVGESGCGKTTLGRTILRLVEPTKGSIKFNGQDITAIEERALRALRKDMQIIFQDPYSSLNPRLTVGQAITEPMKTHGIGSGTSERKKIAIEMLERVSMNAEHFDRYPHEFSGGQRQRICIARAIVLKPKFVICDESVSALDVSVQAQVLNLLNELKEEFGLTYIFISHDLSVVRFMSDRMMVMREGRIEELGIADDVYKNPVSDYTRSLIAAIPKGDLK